MDENNMNSWQDFDTLVNDYRLALIEENNDFSRKILTFLNTSPETLVREFDDRPNAVLRYSHGKEYSLWTGRVKIDGEYYSHPTVIKRIKELLVDN